MNGDPISAQQSDHLLAHVGWIRELARHMVADADRADDLAQETCVVALARRPRDLRSFRCWLEIVMRNLVRQSARSEPRRRARETLAARPERIEPADDVVERAGLQRRIVEAVLELDEPYRSTILWRYFDDQPPREIARRLGLPTTTVQSRLKRGLRRLRERLGDGRGERGAWIALLVPRSSPAQGSIVLATGGVIVKAKMTLALVSFAVLATVVGIASLSDPTDAPLVASDELALDGRGPGQEALQTGLTATGASEGRTPSATAEALPVSEDASAVVPNATRRVRGRVLDAEANAVGGLALAFEAGEQKVATRSRAGGWFEVETAADQGTISSSEATVATVRKGTYRATSSFEPVVIVAPTIDVGGSVLDPDRMPHPGARVSLVLPEGFETRFGQVLEATRVLAWTALTDAQGRFALAGIPQVSGAQLRVLVDGYEPASQAEPEFSDPTLCFVLERPKVLAAGALRGRVLDHEGRKVAGARVAAGLTSTVTDDEGAFALDLSRAVTAELVTAVKAGYRPASLERPDAPGDGRTGWPDFVELRLAGPSLSIRGHVVDPEGEPRAGVRVWIGDPTPFGLIGTMPVQSENLMAGAIVPARALEPDPTPPSADGDDVRTHRNAGGPPTACWYWIVTGEDGSFELAGLDEREYTLRLLDTKTLHGFESDRIPAGERHARIVMPPPPVFPRLAGRVLTIGDRPVEGARLLLRTTSFEVRTRYYGGTLNVLMMNEGGETTTDAQGRFEFRNVPREGVFFVIRSDRIVPSDWSLPAGVDPEALDVRVDARCQLEVRLKAPFDRADSVSMSDADGNQVDLITADQETINLSSTIALVAGRSGVVSASSSARTLELRKEGRVVETIPVLLVPDEVNLIER